MLFLSMAVFANIFANYTKKTPVRIDFFTALVI